MPENYTPVDLSRASEYYALWDKLPLHSLDYSLVNLWGWQDYYGLEWSFEDGLCWIRQTNPCGVACWAPVGDWDAVDWKAVLRPGMKFIRVPERLASMWKEALGDAADVSEDRGQWEYLYLQSELATLPGSRFHKKKNHLSSFIRTYGEPDYRPVDDRMIEDCLALQDTWCQWHNCADSSSLKAENEAINQVLAHYSSFRNLCGGSIYIDGEIVAFTLGEKLDGTTIGVHFEKGITGVKGIYQAINYAFVNDAGPGYTYINRAQDLDEEGLRKAKESYHPVDYVRKSRVEIR